MMIITITTRIVITIILITTTNAMTAINSIKITAFVDEVVTFDDCNK